MRILTIDVEEWYHILDHQSTKTHKEWSRFESRINENMDKIFEVLDQYGYKATFFCVGWIAKKYPSIIKRIKGLGYEIGSHSHMHQLVYEMNPKIFAQDLSESIMTLEDLSGSRIRYFRAPGFSITTSSSWVFDVLAQHNIDVDCSVFPASRAHGGMPSYGRAVPSIVSVNGIKIKELPINSASFFGVPMIFSGGGYFRLLPYPIIKALTNKSTYMMTYLHPRDLDAGQPIINDLSSLRKFKSYVGLKTAEGKLRKWLSDFDFIDIGEAENLIDWDTVPIVLL